MSQIGKQLAEIRDRLFSLAQLQRHHLVLDLNAQTGLLTWEALRQVPEGGVYACISNSAEAELFKDQATILPELMRPAVLNATLNQLPNLLKQEAQDIQFDYIIGRNALLSESNKVELVNNLIPWLSDEGILVLAETVPRYTQRLYNLLEPSWLTSTLLERLKLAEESIYEDSTNAMINWDGFDLQRDLEQLGLTVKLEQERSSKSMLITSKLIERWFAKMQTSDTRTNYRRHLEKILSEKEVRVVQQVFNQHLCNQNITWTSTIAWLCVKKF